MTALNKLEKKAEISKVKIYFNLPEYYSKTNPNMLRVSKLIIACNTLPNIGMDMINRCTCPKFY